jgi:tRNA 5-methylaminomethyl-2-thiouridine biosynthesis bifunctional protein
MPLTPARLAYTEDGTPWSPDFGDVYHSADGGPGQAEHVFLRGNGLPQRWQGRERFVILETGFGTGLNFLATWSAWRADPRACRRLHYLSVEAHPYTAADLASLHRRWPEFAPLAQRLQAQWPVLTPGLHRIELEGGRLVLTLAFGDALWLLPRLSARVDAFYLDGFDPRRNPDMWRPELFRRLARLAAPDATLATWSVAATVRAGLESAGFRCGKRPGFGRKREMLTGERSAAAAAGRPAAPAREALVIGAGLAGSAICARLAARGWRLTLLERHRQPAREASGNLAGIVRPLLSLDDSIASRFTRAAYLHSLRAWSDMRPTPRWAGCGVLHIARDAGHAARQREVVARHAYPPDYVRYLDRAEASDLVGWPLAEGGWHFPGGGWASPPSVCAALLDGCGETLRVRYGEQPARLERQDEQWQAVDGSGRIIARAPVVILASGAGDLWPAGAPPLPLRRVRGQVSHLPAERLPPLRLALCREGYLTPPVDGLVCVGASYDFDDDPLPRAEAHAGNLQRLAHILPGAAAGIDAARLDGRVGFRCVPPDRLPVVGTLAAAAPTDREARLDDVPRLQGVHALMGLASRGLTWAWLAAELLASRLEDDPLPVETDLADALDPGRFLLRRLRRGTEVGSEQGRPLTGE